MSGGSIRSKRVIDVLSKLISVHGAPRYLRSHNGPDFVSLALLQRAKDERLESVLSELGKPWQNVTNEGVNGKFRDECLVIAWIRNCLEASPPRHNTCRLYRTKNLGAAKKDAATEAGRSTPFIHCTASTRIS